MAFAHKRRWLLIIIWLVVFINLLYFGFSHLKFKDRLIQKYLVSYIEQATGGTLFLDEIGDMSLSAQSKVLRALQESVISRVGGDKHIKVDVRLLAATNKNISEEIRENRFREDLYHRLSVILIHVPGLNERLEDIPLLASHFISQICSEYGMPEKSITDSAIIELQKIDWTGNIRELRNVIERLIILCDKKITGEDVLKYSMPINQKTGK